MNFPIFSLDFQAALFMADLHEVLWKENQDLARSCLEHPFVEGIAKGTLSKPKFKRYAAQDAFFLRSFGQAYALAITKCPSLKDVEILHDLLGGVLKELKLHERYLETLEIEMDEIHPEPATSTYMDFLLKTAWYETLAEIFAAMTPCMRLYAFLGQEIMKQNPPSDDCPFKDWILTYQSPEFEKLASKLEQLLDRYGVDEPSVHEAYRYAMQCELDFFQANWSA